MSFINKIILKETFSNFFHFKIFIICLALGVFSITLVNTISSSIFFSMEKNATTILGGTTQISTRGAYFNKEIINWLKKQNLSFSEITEMRTMAFKKDSEELGIIVNLKSIDKNYPLFGKLGIEYNIKDQGLEKSKLLNMEIFVEDSLISRLDVKIGDKIFIGNFEYVIKGTINDEPDKLTNLISIGPRVIISKEDLIKSGLNTSGSLVNHRINIKNDISYSEELIKRIKKNFPKEPLRFESSTSSSQTSTQQFINQLKVILILSGITALLLGGLGISNSISHYLMKKNKNIAILKSLGAKSSDIFLIYLAQTVFMSIIGIFIGFVIGILVSYIILQYIPLGLNIDTKTNFNIETFYLALSYGLITTLIFALWPLAKAKNTKPSSLFRYIANTKNNVPEKLYIFIIIFLLISQIFLTIYLFDFSLNSIWFVLGCFGLIIFFFFISNITINILRNFSILTKYFNTFAITNILAPNSPSKNVITCFGIGITLLIVISLVEFNINKEINLSINESAPSFFLVDIQKSQYNKLENLISNSEGFENINAAPSLRGRLIKVKNLYIENYKLADNAQWLKKYDFGATFSNKLPINSNVIEGDWWPLNYNGIPLISIDKNIANDLKVGIGDSLTFNILGREITAKISNLREINWQSFGINFFVIFSPGILENSPYSYLATAKINTKTEINVFNKIVKKFPNITVIRIKDAVITVTSTLEKISNAARGISVLTILVGVFVLAGAISASYDSRIYSSIIMKVMGATPYYILRVFLLEFFYLSVITSFISCVVGISLAWVITTYLINIGFSLNIISIIYAPILGIFLVCMIGLIGTKKILSSPINSTLRIFSN
ncbi:MAG: hypothetical protein CMM49_03690 [Rhodospirillaceae bacterium]|nr:hypothetical protein [Rhodospirillaceae bacterium]|tara:strand:- start:6311 stop:8836 length:2526 start_codon:yes stop_codon:yes gene_type:complete